MAPARAATTATPPKSFQPAESPFFLASTQQASGTTAPTTTAPSQQRGLGAHGRGGVGHGLGGMRRIEVVAHLGERAGAQLDEGRVGNGAHGADRGAGHGRQAAGGGILALGGEHDRAGCRAEQAGGAHDGENLEHGIPTQGAPASCRNARTLRLTRPRWRWPPTPCPSAACRRHRTCGP